MPSLAQLAQTSKDGSGLADFLLLQNARGGKYGGFSTDNDEEKARMLAAVQKYDPTAMWQDGEDGARMVFDGTKLPTTEHGQAYTHIRAMDKGNDALINKGGQWDDSVYGGVTDSRNVKKQKPVWWETVAPMLVGMGGPALGAALAGAGIGGAAGLTSAVTSGAAGVGSGAATQLPAWATQLISKAPQYARQFDNGQGFNLSSLFGAALGAGGNALGLPSGVTSAGTTLARLAGRH
jgi:hypothetical protein